MEKFVSFIGSVIALYILASLLTLMIFGPLLFDIETQFDVIMDMIKISYYLLWITVTSCAGYWFLRKFVI